MAKRFLYVQYGGNITEIDTADMQRMSHVQEKVKQLFEEISVGYSKIHFNKNPIDKGPRTDRVKVRTRAILKN
jgi:hypothetical protein